MSATSAGAGPGRGTAGKQLPEVINHSPAGTSRQRLALNSVVGGHDLSAWQPVKGVTWIQTRLPAHARRLSQRRDSRLVVSGVSGGYLRTYEFRRGLAWARRLISRYTKSDKATNAGKSTPPPLASAAGPAGSIKGTENESSTCAGSRQPARPRR